MKPKPKVIKIHLPEGKKRNPQVAVLKKRVEELETDVRILMMDYFTRTSEIKTKKQKGRKS